LEIILSFYCAQILIRLLIKFTERKTKESILQRSEARDFLNDMDKRPSNIKIDSAKKMTKLLTEKATLILTKDKFSSPMECKENEGIDKFKTNESSLLLPKK